MYYRVILPKGAEVQTVKMFLSEQSNLGLHCLDLIVLKLRLRMVIANKFKELNMSLHNK